MTFDDFDRACGNNVHRSVAQGIDRDGRPYGIPTMAGPTFGPGRTRPHGSVGDGGTRHPRRPPVRNLEMAALYLCLAAISGIAGAALGLIVVTVRAFEKRYPR
jgi:hypothetical protein